MQPLIAFYEVPEKGSWALPVFHDLVARGIEWAKEPALTRAAAA
jgi:hypothetical protein